MVWPMLAAGAAVGGGMLTLVGSAKSAKAQRAAADYNAKIMERNAEMAEQAGKQQIFMNQRDNIRFGNIATDFIKNQQAAYAASGVVSGQDTALTVALASANNADEAIRNRTYEAEVKALGYREKAVGMKMQAGVTRMEGHSKAQATQMQGWTSLLGSASTAAGFMI